MKKALLIALGALTLIPATRASSIIFNDATFTEITPGIGGPEVFSETVDGVVFTFTAINNLVGGSRFIGYGDGTGMRLGGGGGSTIIFSMSPSQNVTLSSYSTNDSGGFALGSATFDILDGGSSLSVGNSIASGVSGTFALASAPVSLTGGETYTFDINNTGAGVQGWITSLEFTAVPEPSSGLIVACASGVVALLVRRRTANAPN